MNRDDALMCTLCQAVLKRVPPKHPPAVTGHPAWPPLPLAPWQDTLAALHRWLQVVGKLRLACTPWTNHSWHVTLYTTVRGLTTTPMSCGTLWAGAQLAMPSFQTNSSEPSCPLLSNPCNCCMPMGPACAPPRT